MTRAHTAPGRPGATGSHDPWAPGPALDRLATDGDRAAPARAAPRIPPRPARDNSGSSSGDEADANAVQPPKHPGHHDVPPGLPAGSCAGPRRRGNRSQQAREGHCQPSRHDANRHGAARSSHAGVAPRATPDRRVTPDQRAGAAHGRRRPTSWRSHPRCGRSSRGSQAHRDPSSARLDAGAARPDRSYARALVLICSAPGRSLRPRRGIDERRQVTIEPLRLFDERRVTRTWI